MHTNPECVQEIPLGTVSTILRQCAEGMKHLHSQGIIHRDFRAANILISDPRASEMSVVVADFGVSHQLKVYENVEKVLTT